MEGSAIFSSAVVRVNKFVQKDVTKDDGVLLFCIAGEIPNKNVIAWQIADSKGFQLNKKYEVQVREDTPNEYGRQFIWDNLGEWTDTAIAARKEYGYPVITNVKNNEPFTSLGSE